jgi:hypothetical protein
MRRWADPERARDAATLLPFAAAILILPPVVLLFAVPLVVAGIPLIVVYIFGAWAAIVLATWWVARNPAITGLAPDDAHEAEAEAANRSVSGQG